MLGLLPREIILLQLRKVMSHGMVSYVSAICHATTAYQAGTYIARLSR
jgi:hypothetical protein